jgi:outer membrane biosynthesis protein TonB
MNIPARFCLRAALVAALFAYFEILPAAIATDETPAATAADETPAATTAAETPAAPAPAETPAATATAETPAAPAPADTPAPAAPVETPAPVAPVETPAPAAPPAPTAAVETPAAASAIESLAPAAADENIGQQVATIAVPTGLSAANVQAAILQAVIRLKWELRGNTDGRIVCHHARGMNEATLTIKYDAAQVAIFAVGHARKGPLPVHWIDQVEKEINLELSATRKR